MRVSRLLPFAGLALAWSAGAAWWAYRTYADAIDHRSSTAVAWLWIVAGVVVTAALALVLCAQALRAGRGERTDGRLYRALVRAITVLGSASLITAVSMQASHAAWRLAVIAFVGSAGVVWPVGFLWLLRALTPLPAPSV